MLYSVIIPVHNEKEFIRKMVKSLLIQTIKPIEIVIIDDNSTDGTNLIIRELVKHNKLIKSYKHSSSDSHRPGAKVVNAFLFGLEKLKEKYEVIAKLDSDILLPKNYFQALSKIFKRPDVGIVGGFLYKKNNKGESVIDHPMDVNHVRGAIKSYSKLCYEKMGGLRASMGWDSIDEILACYHGFKTITLKELKVIHLRPTASLYSDRLSRLQGEAFYKMRYGLFISVLASLKILFIKKNLFIFLGVFSGVIVAYFKKPKYIVSKKEGEYIRKYRINKVLNGFYKKVTVTKII
jgi:glycosyltransferase involved in cell wall biosynthesis